jgi:hypothetical protein
VVFRQIDCLIKDPTDRQFANFVIHKTLVAEYELASRLNAFVRTEDNNRNKTIKYSSPLERIWQSIISVNAKPAGSFLAQIDGSRQTASRWRQPAGFRSLLRFVRPVG